MTCAPRNYLRLHENSLLYYSCSSVSTFPIFSSFDLRGDLPDPDGKIWAGEERGGGGGSGGNSNVGGKRDHEDDGYRAQLHTKSQPTAVLSLLGVTEKDAGTYKCRVDFKRSPTRYWKVNLDVIGKDSFLFCGLNQLTLS